METVARPYARAAFMTAEQSDTSSALSDWLAFIESVSACVQNAKYMAYLTSPAVTRKHKRESLFNLLEASNVKVEQRQKNFLGLLLENGRLSLMPFISQLFKEMKLQAESTEIATVRSAYELSAQESEAIERRLSELRKKPVQIETMTDESLIGGLVILMDGKSWDYSIRGKLEKLENNL